MFSAPRTDEDRREDSPSGAYRAGAPGTASSRSRRRSPSRAEEFLHAQGGGSCAVAPAGGSRVVLVLVRDDDRKTISHGGIAGGGAVRRGLRLDDPATLYSPSPASFTLIPSI